MNIMPYFSKQIHVYCCYLNILKSLKYRMPQKITIAFFGHPVSKSWLKAWLPFSLGYVYLSIKWTYMNFLQRIQDFSCQNAFQL